MKVHGVRLVFLMAMCGPVAVVRAQTVKAPAGALDAFSQAVESMAQRVSPSVVQILVTRYDTHQQNAATAW